MNSPRAVVYDIRHQHGSWPLIVNSPQQLDYCFRKFPNFQVVYQPSGFGEEEFEQVCELCLRTGNMLFIVEEADTFANKSRITPMFRKCINWGRMEGLGIACISPRPANLHNDCIAQSNHVFVFRTQLPNDLQWLKQFLPPESVSQLPTLEEYHYLYWNGDTWYIANPIEASS